jgi:hypothetical protein
MAMRLAAIAFLGLGLAAFVGAEPMRDVRKLNDNAIRLRKSASTSAAVIAKYDKGTPFLVLETGKKKETIEGKTGFWLRGRVADGSEGWFFGPYLDQPKSGHFTSADFAVDGQYQDYLSLALRRGERVRATEDYEKIHEGDLGWFSSYGEGDPPFLVVWDDDIEATPSDEAIDAELPRIFEDRIYFVYASTIEIVGDEDVADFPALALDWANARADEFVEGATVSLGRHLVTDPEDEGSDNWAEEMSDYVGETATITEVMGEDPWGRPIVHVDIDDGSWQWRIENMRLESASDYAYGEGDDGYAYGEGDEEYVDDYAAESTETYGKIEVGSVVILGRHDEVDGDTNWNDEMDQYVGKAVKVTELVGADGSGCLCVSVDGNDFVWRVRNLRLKGSGEAGSYGFDVGDSVILGRHRMVNGENNWAEEMEDYVGETATITSLVGFEEGDSHCFLVYVDIDDGEWVWRVENMTPAD